MDAERELPVATLDVESNTVALLNKSEIDQQIATAHRWPRTIKAFRDEVLALATLNESVAEECSYALPRDGKTITGPSARFAEILASAYGNCRAGARVVDERPDYIVAQGAFIDLQKNVAITYEVQRRIINSRGQRYSADMIAVTANAACSIALRNAVLKGVPKALWADLWEKARQVAIGDATTLANKRANAVKKFAHYGISEAQIIAKLGRASLEDVTVPDLEILLGLFTAVKEGDISPEEAFATGAASTGAVSGGALGAINENVKAGGDAAAKPRKAAKEPATVAAGSASATSAAQPAATGTAPAFTYAEVREKLEAAKNADELADAVSLIDAVPDPAHRAELHAVNEHRIAALGI